MNEINLKLSLDETNLVLMAMQKMVVGISGKIQAQAQAQINQSAQNEPTEKVVEQ